VIITKTRIYERPTTATDAVSVGDAQRARRSTVAPRANASFFGGVLYFFSYGELSTKFGKLLPFTV
jgi:hypothetical protein